MQEFFRRLRYLLNHRQFDRELAAEMEAHREMAARQGGVPFGNALRLREEARDAWGWTWIERFLQDLHYAARIFGKSPGFTLAAILMLALGIGVNVAAFGFFNLLLLRPLPVRGPATLLRFERCSANGYWSDVPYPEMTFFRDHSKTLSAILGSGPARVSMDGEQKPLRAIFVTPNFFSELGATAALGRTLDPIRDSTSNAEPVIVLSYGFWQRRFGADPSLVGQTIRVNGKPATVVGIAASEFTGLSFSAPDLWLPLKQQPYFVDGSQLLHEFSAARADPDREGVNLWGRLAPGFAPKAAEDELRFLAKELRKQYPADIWKDESLPSLPGGYASLNSRTERGSGSPKNGRAEVYPIIALVGALTLLILTAACGNLGSLLLARGVAREREIAIRVSVGAGKGRLVRQLFTESLLLALAGSIAGLALGYGVLHGLMGFIEAPSWMKPTPDWRVLAFSLSLGFAAAILFGLTPALQVARQRHRATIIRQFLIGAQVAASCILLIVAGLLVRALHHAIFTSPGFAYEQVVSIDPALGAHGYSTASSQAYLEALESRLRSVAGVESVSLASVPPLGHKSISSTVTAAGRTLDVHVNSIDPEFFHTMEIPLLRGRNLKRGDRQVVVISQSLALHQWPAQDPLGKQLPMGDSKSTVVGVCGNARLTALEDPDAVEAYFLADATDGPGMTVIVRTAAAPESLLPVVASIAKAIDPKVFPQIETLKGAFREKLQDPEHNALLVSILGVVALLLACLGIIGLVAYAVSQRTKEIGIRMALGAKPSHVLAIVLRQFSHPVVAGLLVGTGGAAALSQMLRRELYGISNLDPITYFLAVGIFIVTAILAALLPARRALRVDPLRALRYD